MKIALFTFEALPNARAVRQRVAIIKAKLERGLHLIHHVAQAEVEETRFYLSAIMGLLLDGAFGKGVPLVGFSAFERYLVSILFSVRDVILNDSCRNWSAL